MARTIRKTTRTRDEIEDDEDERPARRSQRDSEERPARGRARSARSEEPEDDEDEKPRRRTSRVKEEPKRRSQRSANSGWDAADEVKKSLPKGGDFAEDLKIPDRGSILIKFVEDEPFDSYKEHWITQKGKCSFTCADDDCPLCDAGHRPSAKTCFNVISMEDPDKPALFRWRVGPQMAEEIRDFTEDKRYKPLSREDVYFEIKRTKTEKKTTTTIKPVKARDLPEDFETEPLSKEEIEDVIEDAGGLHDWESTEDTPLSVLEEQADNLSNG